MRLIDADAVIPKGTIVTDAVIAVHNALAKAPTIEAEPVVRCKDCIHRLQGGYCKTVTNARATKPVNDNFFCGYGERRGGDVEGI